MVVSRGAKKDEIIPFIGKGFTREYVESKSLPLLNSKNIWVSGDLRMHTIKSRLKDKQLQLYMKQHTLKNLFNIEFRKEDLLNNKFTVAFYEYTPTKFKKTTLYAVVSLREFLSRYGDEISVVLNETELKNLLLAIEEKENWLKRDRYVANKIEKLRTENVVYLICGDSYGRKNLKRYTSNSCENIGLLNHNRYMAVTNRLRAEKHPVVVLEYDSKYRLIQKSTGKNFNPFKGRD